MPDSNLYVVIPEDYTHAYTLKKKENDVKAEQLEISRGFEGYLMEIKTMFVNNDAASIIKFIDMKL